MESSCLRPVAGLVHDALARPVAYDNRRTAMIKVSVMYPNTPGARFDHAYYRDKHMPLLKARMGEHCKSYTVDKGLAEIGRASCRERVCAIV